MQQITSRVRERIPALLCFPSGWEVQSSVWVQQGTAEKEPGQVGLWGCNPPAFMNKTKSKVPSSYTIPASNCWVHCRSPRAEWTFPGTNLRISPETEAFISTVCCCELRVHGMPYNPSVFVIFTMITPDIKQTVPALKESSSKSGNFLRTAVWCADWFKDWKLPEMHRYMGTKLPMKDENVCHP